MKVISVLAVVGLLSLAARVGVMMLPDLTRYLRMRQM
jgi:hypothetical protein